MKNATRDLVDKAVEAVKKSHDGTQQLERLAALIAQCTLCLIETIVEESPYAKRD